MATPPLPIYMSPEWQAGFEEGFERARQIAIERAKSINLVTTMTFSTDDTFDVEIQKGVFMGVAYFTFGVLMGLVIAVCVVMLLDDNDTWRMLK